MILWIVTSDGVCLVLSFLCIRLVCDSYEDEARALRGRNQNGPQDPHRDKKGGSKIIQVNTSGLQILNAGLCSSKKSRLQDQKDFQSGLRAENEANPINTRDLLGKMDRH
jgi:hypothetical protein